MTLALEQAIKFKSPIVIIAASAKMLLNNNPDTQYFNIDGVEIPRTELETWAAGRFNNNHQIEADLQQFRGNANVHLDGLRTRGRHILDEIVRRTEPEQRLSLEQARSELKQAIGRGFPGNATQAAAGLEHALGQTERVEEGLNTTTAETLAAMWSYIQTCPPELRQNLSDALLGRLADIGHEKPCNTGCVQRILYATEGVDLSLASGEPDLDTIRSEITSIAGQINNRYEMLYGDSAYDPDAPSSSSLSALASDEKKLIATYQGNGEIDEELIIEIKQDMLRQTALDDLVNRRGWDRQNVEKALAPVLESMQYL